MVVAKNLTNAHYFSTVTCVQFDSDTYTISSLDLSLSVTLTLSGLAQAEPFDAFVIAKDTLSADCKLIVRYHLVTIHT